VSSGSKDNHEGCCYICENCVALCAMIIMGKREQEIREREKETPYLKKGCRESVVLCDVCEHTDNSPPSNESEKQNNPYEEEKLIKDALPSETYAHYGRFGSIKRGRKL
jgi:hypothetical protein